MNDKKRQSMNITQTFLNEHRLRAVANETVTSL